LFVIDFIKLKQIYGLDPLTSSIQGGFNLIKENAPGATAGLALSALNPDVAKALQDAYPCSQKNSR
jgi:hypothetical protein